MGSGASLAPVEALSWEVRAAVVAHGGRILMEKTTIATVGDLIWFQDPADSSWHALRWEHAGAVGGPFSVLHFAESDLSDVVYLEQLASSQYLDKQDMVDKGRVLYAKECGGCHEEKRLPLGTWLTPVMKSG